jgi:hypothetical protein
MRSTNSRLRELVESVGYQKDFKELKKSILLLRESKKYIKGIPTIVFLKVDPEQPQDTAIRHGKIPLKELQGLLKNGNVNDHRIQIPDVYSNFKVEHRLKYLFDPGKPYPTFNPFDDEPIAARLPLDGGTRIPITVDIKYPSKLLESQFKIVIRRLKEMWKLKQERERRYSEDQIYRVKELRAKGMTPIEITRLTFPGFNPRDDYIFAPEDEVINGEKSVYEKPRNKKAWAYYNLILRLEQEAKKRKP